MIIEIDVSHVVFDSLTSFFATMIMSLDTYCSRYVVAIQINEQRVKLIASHIIVDMMTSMFNHWFQNIDNNNLSQHVIYFRDDVSVAQYMNMLDAQYVNMLAFEIVFFKNLLYQLSKHNLNYKISAQDFIIEANLTWCKCILNRIRMSQLFIYCKLFFFVVDIDITRLRSQKDVVITILFKSNSRLNELQLCMTDSNI